MYLDVELTRSGQRELIGYILNDASNDYACKFLSNRQQTSAKSTILVLMFVGHTTARREQENSCSNSAS